MLGYISIIDEPFKGGTHLPQFGKKTCKGKVDLKNAPFAKKIPLLSFQPVQEERKPLLGLVHSWYAALLKQRIPFFSKKGKRPAPFHVYNEDIVKQINKSSRTFMKKNTSVQKIILIAVLCMLLIAGFYGIFTWWNRASGNAPIKAYEIFMGSKDLGAVSRTEDVQKILDLVKEEQRKKYGLDVVLDQKVDFRATQVSEKAIQKIEKLEVEIRKIASYKVIGAAIVIDGKIIKALKTQEDAKWVLEQVLAPYQKMIKEKKAETIRFVEKVEIKIEPVDFSLIDDREKLVKMLVMGDVEQKLYVIQEGDTLSEIANTMNIKVVDIRKANPVLTDSDAIHPGMKLNMTVPKNMVNVEVVSVTELTESLPFTIEVREDKSLYKTQKKVIQKGIKGKRKIVARVTQVNGVIKTKKVLSEVVVQKPVKQIIVKGTGSVPSQVASNSTSSSMGLPTRGRVSSTFGMRWGKMHEGMDIAAPMGSPIYAANGGTVIFSGYRGGYGNCIEISHGGGLTTRYGHCSKLLLGVGKTVKKGQLIALVGSTGHSTGPHVHFEVRMNGKPVNPAARLK